MSVFYATPATYITMSTQLDDGTASLPRVVKATVRTKTGTVIMSGQSLTHVGNGLFMYSGFQMPDESMIVVQYIVYLPDGVTMDETFTIDSDTIVRSSDVVFSSGAGDTISNTYVILDEFIVEVDDV